MNRLAACFGAMVLAMAQGLVLAADAPKTGMEEMDAAHQADAKKLLDGGIKFLLSQRAEDGSWAGPKDTYKPAFTGLVLKALLGSPDFTPGKMSKENEAIIKKAFDVLLTFKQKDGGIYNAKEGQTAYTTAIAVMALKASGDPAYNETVNDAVKFMKGLQILPGQESPDGKIIAKDDPKVGGVGYGKPPAYNPNLSVLGFVLDAFDDAKVDPKDPAVQRAVDFLSRLQNSEENKMPWAKEGSKDGGFAYALDESKAGKDMRSYGSMTYVGFKSMIYAGLAKDDPRVQAAYRWIQKFWDLDHNPNMPGAQSEQGLYYYYLAFAKGLRAWGQPVIQDKDKKDHNWRQELVDALKRRVKDDGAWENTADRWEEGSKVLVTSYVVGALEQATK